MKPDSKTDAEQYIGTPSIQSALRSGWTHREKNPPEDSGYANWLVGVNFVPSDNYHRVVEFTAAYYEIKEKPCVRRMLRYGVPKIQQMLTDGPLGDLRSFLNVATYASSYNQAHSYGYSPLHETEASPIDWGHSKGNSKVTYKIVWLQHDGIESVAKPLGITKADAMRWALFKAGVELGREEVLPDPLYRDISSTVEEFENYLEERIRWIKGAAIMTIMEAASQDRHSDIREYCEDEAPDLWREYLDALAIAHAQAMEEEFLFPIANLSGTEYGKI